MNSMNHTQDVVVEMYSDDDYDDNNQEEEEYFFWLFNDLLVRTIPN